MPETEQNPQKNWFEGMRDRHMSLRHELEAVDLRQTDTQLASEVRAIVSQMLALEAAIEEAEKYFNQ